MIVFRDGLKKTNFPGEGLHCIELPTLGFQKADVPAYSVNDLRTTFIIENLKAGVDLVLLSQVSGHKRLSTTERYLELAEVKEPGKKQKLEEL